MRHCRHDSVRWKGLFGGIPGLGEGKVTKALGGLPGVSKTVDIVGEGVENALGTVIDPFLKRATYNKNAQPATPKEIGQSALLGMATSTVFQLPSMIDDIAAQYTKGLNSIRQKMAMDDLAAVYEKNVENNSLHLNGLDAPDLTGYDGHKEADLYGRGEEETSATQRYDGVDVWGQDRRSDTGGTGKYQKMDGGIPQAQSGEASVADWARGHIVERPVNPVSVIAENQAKDYYPDVYVVEDSALKARRPNAWATTSKGIIYLSDAIPEELADVVGCHEVVHAAKQRNDKAYVVFLDDVGDRINYQSEQSDMVLTIILKANSQGRSMFDLNFEEQKRVFDELNAVIWGYYKADPENANAQFSGMFKDYDSYIAELDAIMEEFKISNWGQWDD